MLRVDLLCSLIAQVASRVLASLLLEDKCLGKLIDICWDLSSEAQEKTVASRLSSALEREYSDVGFVLQDDFGLRS